MLLIGTAGAQQSDALRPVWKQPESPSAPEPYTGKYCDYSAFDGLEFTFSTDPQWEKYGFQSFTTSADGLASVPFAEYAGKKGKIGRQTTARTKEVLVEDCTVAYLFKDGEIQPEDAAAFGIELKSAPPTTWVLREKTDPLTDAKSCQVIPQGVRMPFPMFYYHSREGVSVGVVGGDFPGKQTTFRVDKNRAIAGREGLSGGGATALIAQIRSGGKVLLVGSYAWPHEYQQISEFNLVGLVDRLDQCKRWISK